MRFTLHDGWTVEAVGGEVPSQLVGVRVPAVVPGCVHLDLLAAGLIDDPYLDENETRLGWIGRVDWRYQTTFAWEPDLTYAELDLVALGLDTLATIELNGVVVAQTQNMHRSFRFPVGPLIRPGRNDLAITFAAGLTGAEAMSAAIGPLPHVNTHPFNAIRKSACNFGWDWGPDLVTAGIWRALSLEGWQGARIISVRPLVDVTSSDAGSAGVLRAHVEVQRAVGRGEPLTVTVEIAGVTREGVLRDGETSTVIEVTVPDVQLWWPYGYGDQPLYPVTVTLFDDNHDDTNADRPAPGPWRGRVGFRTVTVNTVPDEHGTPFTLMVNEVPVFARGVNWIPDDVFPARLTQQRYATRLTQARDAGINLIRVWGGGLYESEDFYNACDELGLLVWQDFLFACAAYSEEEPLRSEVIAEAREAITRLSGHASLGLWNGCNENLWGYEDWDWKKDIGERTWGWGYYTEILPALVAELDPTRPYSPGSPYSASPTLHPNDPAHGTSHNWEVWNRTDYTEYRDVVPRFCSEFGFQGPPTWATLTRAIHDDPLTPDSSGMLLHQKAEDGDGKLLRGLVSHLPEPRTFVDWHWATSLNQARAVALGVEHFRSWTPICMGAIVWQLNDCWPASSWAAIDGDGRRKPLWYALRRANRERFLTIQPRSDGLALVAVNDSSAPWADVVEVTRRTLAGVTLATVSVAVDLAPRAATTVLLPRIVAHTDDPAGEVLLAGSGGDRAWWHFAEDVAAALPPPGLSGSSTPFEGGYQLTVTTQTFVRDLALLVDRLDPAASVDDMLVTLLPGESVTFEIRTNARLALADLMSPLVLRSANQLVHPVP